MRPAGSSAPAAFARRAASGSNSPTRRHPASGARADAAAIDAETGARSALRCAINNMPAAVMWGDFWQQSKFESAMVGVNFVLGSDPDVTPRFGSGAIHRAKGGTRLQHLSVPEPRGRPAAGRGRRQFDTGKAQGDLWGSAEADPQRPCHPAAVPGHHRRGRQGGAAGLPAQHQQSRRTAGTSANGTGGLMRPCGTPGTDRSAAAEMARMLANRLGGRSDHVCW